MAYKFRIKHTPVELHLSTGALDGPGNHDIIRSTIIAGYQSQSNLEAITWE